VKLKSFNGSQRGVIVVAFGFALYTIGQWLLVTWELGARANVGWVAYAPLSNSFNLPRAWHPWAVTLYWLILIAVWMFVSLVILQRRHDETA
jgi:hypothetical protein